LLTKMSRYTPAFAKPANAMLLNLFHHYSHFHFFFLFYFVVCVYYTQLFIICQVFL
jgi:hypothetical protein